MDLLADIHTLQLVWSAGFNKSRNRTANECQFLGVPIPRRLNSTVPRIGVLHAITALNDASISRLLLSTRKGGELLTPTPRPQACTAVRCRSYDAPLWANYTK